MDRKLAEIPEQDRGSREFFASLSPTLRKRLMEGDAGNFVALKKAVEECGGQTFAAKEHDGGEVASATEMTGKEVRGKADG
ncbi:hypothetical protein [Ruminococcus sp.]|uniref:hypothetical protein n=1 Tax=Ruminococcus sp. TaxID=41978 RepID=UPI0025E07574|nr:hypothetical protein [Ruminococcus sp.]MBQ8965889.1 hypothetical protein [Ruminococcus sp.]